MPNAVDALRRQWAKEDSAKKKRRKAKKQSAGGDGFFDSIRSVAGDAVPEFGVGNAFDMLTSIPAGLGYIGSALAPGGVAAGEGIGTVGKGIAHSLENTLSTVAEPAFDALGQQKRFRQGWRNVNNALFPEEMATPHGLIHRSFDKNVGLIPAVIEDVGNVAMVSAPAARLAKVGEVGTLAAPEAISEIAETGGASTRLARQAAKWAGKAAKVEEKIGPEAAAAIKESPQFAQRVRAIKIAEAGAHPYESVFRGTLGKSGTAAQAAERIAAVRKGEQIATEAGDTTPRFIVGPDGTIEQSTDVAEGARIAEADARAGRHAGPAQATATAGVRAEPGNAPGPEGRLSAQMNGEPRTILDAEGNPIEGILARVGPAEEAAIARKGTPPNERLLERHLSRLEGDGATATLTHALSAMQGRLDAHTLRWVGREGERFVEAARRAERNEPWYQEAIGLARNHLVNKTHPEGGVVSVAQANDLIGSEVMARLDGIEMMNRAARETMGGQWDPAAMLDFEKAVGAKKSTIPDELMTPELDAQLDEIASKYRERSKTRVGTLIGDRLGTTGLEDMNSDVPVMTAKQKKEYARIQKAVAHQATVQQRKIVRGREGAMKSVGRLQEEIDRNAHDIENLNQQADELDEVAQSLLHYVAPQMTEAKRPAFWDETVRRTLADEGATADPTATTGRAFDTGDGWTTPMIEGRHDVPIEEFGPDTLEEVYQRNRNFLSDPDAKIVTRVHVTPDGRQVVDIDFAQNTVAGNPMTRWQAQVLGQSRGHQVITSPSGEVLRLSDDPAAAQIASVYRPIVRNPRSQFNKTMRGLYSILDRYEPGTSAYRQTLTRIDAMMNEALVEGARTGSTIKDLDAFFRAWREAVSPSKRGALADMEEGLQSAVRQAPGQTTLPLTTPERFNLHVPAEGPSIQRNIYETSVFPGETPTQARVRTYRATRAADDARLARLKATERGNRIARLQKKQEELAKMLKDESSPAEIEHARRTRQISRSIDKLGKALQDPATGQVPAKWQPLWDAYKRIIREAETNPALELPDEWVDQFSEVLALAARNGFDPQHVRSFTPKQVEGLMYGQMRLGADFRPVGAEIKSGTRAARTRPHAVSQSVSALAAAMVEVVHESQTNHLADFIEGNMASKVVGGFIPDGWVAWDPVRKFIVTGEKMEQGGRVVETVGQAPTMMIPKAVANTIRNMGRDYTHWSFKALSKVQNPWRALILTMTPRWYVNNFIGNFILTSAAGVSLGDWLRSWHEYRQREFVGQDLKDVGTGDLARGALRDVAQGRGGRQAQPFSDIPGVTGASIYSDLGDPNSLMLPKGFREKARYIAGTTDRNKVVTAYQLGIAKLSRANEVVDEMARAAAYFSATRKGLTPEAALMRAYQSLIDYGDLSPIERQMVRSVIPFYAWQKGVLKLVVKNGIEHPAAAAMVLQLHSIAEEWFQDKYGTELPKGYSGLIPFGSGSINTRGLNPFADAGSLVTAQGIARSMNPFAEAIVRSELGAPEGGIVKDQRVNEYGRLVPDVNIAQDLTENAGGGLPQVQLGQRLTGTSPSPYSESLGRSFGRFTGVPVLGKEETGRLVTRTRESRATLAGPKPKKRKKGRKKKSPLEKMLARLKTSSQAARGQ